MMDTVRPPATLFRTDLHTVRASATNERYQVAIWRPFQYETTTESYPTVYVLDGDLLFAAAAQLLATLALGQELPGLLVVGIGYGVETVEEWGARRNRELTPTAVPAEPGSGGAPHLLDFMANDVIPLVDASYRTLPSDRMLYGHSFGGLFVLYALLQQPALFQRYLASSPSLWWDDRWGLGAAEKATLASPTRVCVSVGSNEEDLPLIEEMAAKLRLAGPCTPDVAMLVLEGESHFSTIAPALIRGAKALFA